ncbi:hypothetical protein L0662_13045 [Dyadobacter sp. CY22]|uniref:hypothetical protein n=1 Tax=Dyadobacter chenhuakuii TaxID=2909339 RepID=UPI001F352676|nr:hypothetical protein [Dyadobacter chenhuakuii]MCF2494287.1 hypothetical protein [Dyadobacter chenhuakuii]
MNIWRIHLKPASKLGFNSREHCIEHNLVGIGWPIPLTTSSLTATEYEDQAKVLYVANNDKSWYRAWNSFYYRMQIGDLIWTRTSDGYYYLGRVESEWKYDFSEVAVNADIANIRSCK